MARQSGKGLTESTYLILLSTLEQTHSYGIITKIREMTNQAVDIGAGTLYGALNKMVTQVWIAMTVVDGQKMYVITDKGKSVLLDEIERLSTLVNLGRQHYED